MFKLPTPLWRLSLLLLLFSAGCQNARTAFQFRRPAARPAPLALAPAATAPTLTRRSDSEQVATALADPAVRRAARKLAARPRLVRRLATLAAQRQAPTPPVAGNRPGRLRPWLRPRPAALAPAGTAEAGLGTTFLGIVGIVALVVGLIGLIFAGWGFFGWLAVGGAVLLLISILAPYVGNGHA